MSSEFAPAIGLHSPFGWIGRKALSAVTYLGQAALFAASAVRSLRPAASATPAFFPALMWQLGRIIGMGLPLVALVHVSIGSFLAMQSYFGGTFVDGAGAVVGVGLIRNLAPLMTGMTLAGLLAARTTPELSARARRASALAGSGVGPEIPPEASRLAAIRLVAAMISGPVLAIWGVAIGTVVGWLVVQKILGVSLHNFATMFVDMLWLRDVVGLIVKGAAFGMFCGLFACFEGLRRRSDDGPEAVAAAAFRAACLSIATILLINSSWFLLIYRAGSAFGPTLLTPPSPGLSMD